MTYSPFFRGSTGKGSSRSVQTGYQNGTVSTLSKATVVSVNSSGQIIKVDVTSENNVKAIVGLTALSIPSAASGEVVDCGRLEDITTSFSVGDALYVATDGSLTNSKPDIGVASFVANDWIVFVGVVTQNEFDNTKKDIKILLSVIGRL